MVIRIVTAIVLLASVASTSMAQEMRLDTSKPHVYLAFERLADDLVWLRLRNNSRWAISIRTEEPGKILVPLRLTDGRMVSGLADGLEMSPEYVVENLPEYETRRYWCTSANSWIAPGQSAIFSFPRAELKPVGRICLTFSYEWEDQAGEVEHRVKFSEFNLNQPFATASH